MKLSELVAYRTALNRMNISDFQRSAESELGKYVYLVENNKVQIEDRTDRIKTQLINIQQEYAKFGQEIDQLRQSIDQLIEQSEKPWFQESYRLYDEEMCHDSTQYILERRPVLDSESEITLRSRITSYTDWKYPAMIIRPGLEKFIDDMVGFDPLYIVDQSSELLLPARDRYPVEYQRRLRMYTVRENLDQPLLAKIPDSQFGLCLVYNFFEFKPLEVIRQYLTEIYVKLKPGGTLLMTFNDCDRDKAVMLVEQHYCCYTPGTLIRELAQAIGYQIVFSWDNNGPSTWLEIKKPGVLTSLRGGQSLAKIVAK